MYQEKSKRIVIWDGGSSYQPAVTNWNHIWTWNFKHKMQPCMFHIARLARFYPFCREPEQIKCQPTNWRYCSLQTMTTGDLRCGIGSNIYFNVRKKNQLRFTRWTMLSFSNFLIASWTSKLHSAPNSSLISSSQRKSRSW